MLGNVMPYKCELSGESSEKYSAMYCGLCKTLGRRYGVLSRFALNYDMVFIAMLYDELNDIQPSINSEGCFANPVKKKSVAKGSAGLEYASDMLVMLIYYKLWDNIYDDGFFKKIGNMFLLPFVYFKFKKAKKLRPNTAALIKEQTDLQRLFEKENSPLDKLCLPTCNMTKEILQGCTKDENLKEACGKFGFFMGRVIYLLDALKDREEDEKEAKFNIFNLEQLAEQTAKEECFMSLGEMAYWYRQLPIDKERDILDNIIYLGLARSIEFAGQVQGDIDE